MIDQIEQDLITELQKAIEDEAIKRFERVSNRIVLTDRIPNPVISIKCSKIKYTIKSENAALVIVTVEQEELESWKGEFIPELYEYKLQRDIAAYGFDRLYIAVISGSTRRFIKFDRDQEFIDSIIDLQQQGISSFKKE